MPVVITADEYLEISSVPFATPAWRITDLTSLFDGPDVKGGDRDLPHGVAVAYPRRATITVVDLPLVVFGASDQDGVAYADAREGLEANIAYLRANVVDPLTTGDGTRPAVLHQFSGATLSADVTVISPLRLSRFTPVAARGVLRLSIPTGAFA
jgi:hypothetical protein